jgi:acetyl esterase
MPLHPQAQAIIDMLEAAGFGSLSADSDPAQVREQFAAMRIDPTIELAEVEDRTVPGPDGDLPVRVYRPSKGATLPALVYYHGGGWVIGGIETHDGTCRELAEAVGCTVVSVDYRLAPEHKFPAQVDDCFAALVWVRDHADELSIDRDRIAVAGDSAGGHLAAVTAIHARDAGIPLTFQLLIYPAIEYEFESRAMEDNAEGYFLTREDMRWFYGHLLPDPSVGTDWRVSPRFADNHAGLPPAFVVTAEYDPLRDQGKAYADALEAAGVPTTYRNYEGVFHGFFSMTMLLDTAKDAVRDAAEALRDAFGVRASA